MSKLSFRARALDASKPMPIYLAEELPDLPDYSAINRAVPQMPSGMEKEEESEHHLQRAISGTGLIIPTPEVTQVCDIDFYEKCYPPDYKMPKQHIHMQPLWEEQEAPEYDMDSEDERWLKQQRHPELTELKFEQMMDKLEKSSGQTVVTLNEAKLLLERQDDLVIAVYDYWLNKRLTTQHPLILSVRTESRPGQSSNNPYLAFRRRTEKMQTRKNRKNDESSYEKMLKLRRDLARALNLLELVARRERAKRELVKLTALLAERRYAAGDFANQLLPDPPPRPAYTAVPAFRPEKYSAPHYPPRPQPAPIDAPRQREKRPYKKRKHRHAPVGVAPALRDSGVYTSSEEESPRVEPSSPPDDGPFAFRRKPGCYYEMPTSTLCGDPVDSENRSKDGLFQHELDPRHRYTLTSINHPYPQCIGFARRRVGRGGRVLLDRVATPLDDLWTTLPFTPPSRDDPKRERDEIENKRHRTPKEITTDYHTSGKYPWRHAFRRHLSRNPDLWTDVKPDVTIKPEFIKPEFDYVKAEPSYDSNSERMDIDILPDVVQDSEKCCDNSVRTMDRKRSYSDCSDSSYDSEQSLQPVEQEFERFIDEVDKKWLHFRARPPPSPSPPPRSPSPPLGVGPHCTVAVELYGPNSHFTTDHFSIQDLCDASVLPTDSYKDNFTAGLSEAQMQSMLLETSDGASAGAGDGDGAADPFLLHGQSAGARTDSGRNTHVADSFGSSRVRVTAGDREPIYCASAPDAPAPIAPIAPTAPAAPAVTPRAPRVQATTHATTTTPNTPPKKVMESRPPPLRVESSPASSTASASASAPVPTLKIIEEVNDPPHSSHQINQMHIQTIQLTPAHQSNSHQLNQTVRVSQNQRKGDTIEEVQLPHGVQLKTVQTKHSPLKKHIITSGAGRVRSEPVAVSSAPHHQILAHQASDALKVRLQNHLLTSQGGVLMQNGPFPQVVSLPVQRENVSSITSIAGVSLPGTSSPRRVSAPLVQLAPHKHAGAGAGAGAGTHPAGAGVVVAHSHLQPSKLKVLHAHPLTHTQRTQLLAQNRGITQLPAVVSLATLSDPKSTTLFKAAPGSVAQLFEIKSGQLGKGPHLVNVLRQPPPGKPPVPRLELADRKPKLVFDATLKGNVSAPMRPHRVSVSLDARHLVRGQPSVVRAPHPRHQIQLKNRTLQGNVSAPMRPHRVSVSLDARHLVRGQPSVVRAPHPRHQIQLKNRTLQGNVSAPMRPHRVSVSLDARHLVRGQPSVVRAPHPRHQIQLKNRTLQGNVSAPMRPHRVSVSLDARHLVRGQPSVVRAPHPRHQIQLKNRTLQGNVSAPMRPHRVSVSLDARHLVRGQPSVVRAPHPRHQIQLKNRTLQGLQVTGPTLRNPAEPSTSITIAQPQAKTTSIPSSVVANLLQKNVQLPKGRILSGQKIAISGPGGQALSANVQAIAFTAAQLKASRQTRLIAQPRPTPVAEIVEASTIPVATSSQAHPQESDETETNGAVRRRTTDTLPMEVT